MQRSRWANPVGAKTRAKNRGVYLGTDVKTSRHVRLALDRFKTGVHMIGPPGSGKSRLMLWKFQVACRIPGASVILINPKGELGQQARNWALTNGQTKRLIWFSPGAPGPVMGWNPMYPNGLPNATHAKAVREGILAGRGQYNLDQTAQLGRYLFLALAVTRELGLTLVEAYGALLPKSPTRRAILPKIRDPFLRAGLSYLDSQPVQRQDQLVASSLARLESLIADPMLRSILTQQKASLNFDEVISEGKIFIANLEQYRPLRPEDVRFVGRLLINDILQHVFAQPPATRRRVFLFIDEVHTLATEDLCSALELGRELGLNTIVAHQFMRQLEEDGAGRLRATLMNCARTRIVFGGLTADELEPLVKELFLDQFDPMSIKDEITSLEVEPCNSMINIVTRTSNWTTLHGKSRGSSKTDTEGRASSSSWQRGSVESGSEARSSSHSTGTQRSTTVGQTVLPNDDVAASTSEQHGTSESTSIGESTSRSWTNSKSEGGSEAHSSSVARGTNESVSEQEGEGGSRSETYSPIVYYNKRRVVSSRTFWTQDEFLTMKVQETQGLPQAHFVIKTPGHKAMVVRTPVLGSRALQQRLELVFSQDCYSTPELIEAEEQERHQRLLAEAEPEIETSKGPLFKPLKKRKKGR